ncbi:hypothetical protein BDZ97DRAFT_1659359 [Flammula alnicola]|nr:hypothetical protein BDZ97DRAFT_1659359 [Flammula alnicola]
MFTPPPSPQPARTTARPIAIPESRSNDSREAMESYSSSLEAKRWTGRRFRWAVVLVPLVIIFITARIGYKTSRVAQESSQPLLPISWHGFEEGSSWRHHKRHPEPEPAPQGQSSVSSSPSGSSLVSASATTTATAASSASSSSIPVSSQPVPVIPASPPTSLPTPFPQPFDGTLAQNFSSLTCSNFFTNMTNSAPFRQCRPFSMLLQSSTQFINAQTNLTLMNSIIWGTCNTNVDLSQCEQNMGWFADNLKTACDQELKQLNSMATTTLTALQAFQVMHDVACQADPTSNTYCYLNAVRNSNPADSYYYALPLGIPVPSSSQPTCSACSKSVMSIYASALTDPVQGPQLAALKTTYEPTAALTVQFCGANFAQTTVSAASPSFSRSSWAISGCLAIFAWTILAHAS